MINFMRRVTFFLFLFQVSVGWDVFAAPPLVEVARFPGRQLVGVAVAPSGDIFVSFPYWEKKPDISVAKILPNGELVPYPSTEWNRWSGRKTDVRSHFVAVQSVTIDSEGLLWILDSGKPKLTGSVIPGAAKLLGVDLSTGVVVKAIYFTPMIAKKNSYLNDVRVDVIKKRAYLTDSGAGGLVVVDLTSETSRRVLDKHPSVMAEKGYDLRINGKPLRALGLIKPKIHSDGLALDTKNGFVYYHPLTGTHLYRISQAALDDVTLNDEDLATKVENLGPTTAVDGLEVDTNGTVYLTAIEQNAILMRKINGEISVLVQDQAIQWPDSLAWSATREDLYFTVAQIHRLRPFNWGFNRKKEPDRLYRIRILK